MECGLERVAGEARARANNRSRASGARHKSSISVGLMLVHRLVLGGLARSRWDHQPGDSLRAPASGMAGHGCQVERQGRGCVRKSVERPCTGAADGLPLISQSAARAQQARRRTSTLISELVRHERLPSEQPKKPSGGSG